VIINFSLLFYEICAVESEESLKNR
jgi:hypothetical protein